MNPCLPPMAWTLFALADKPSRSEIIAFVNRAVNAGIRPNYGRASISDKWLIWPETGQCHDYAVTKREELLLRGISAQLCECIAPDGEHHLVLLVPPSPEEGSGAAGSVVLDNLTPEIGPMRYPVVRTQSIDDPDRWEAS